MTPPTRPVFRDGQIITADELNSITTYCDWKIGRLSAVVLVGTIVSCVATALCRSRRRT